jgi:hypothetical protein
VHRNTGIPEMPKCCGAQSQIGFGIVFLDGRVWQEKKKEKKWF